MRPRRVPWTLPAAALAVALRARAQQAPASPYASGPRFGAPAADTASPGNSLGPRVPALPAAAPAASTRGPLASLLAPMPSPALPTAADRTADAQDNVSVQSWARSVRVLREGEVARRGPGSDRARRGTLSLNARLPVYEAALGSGCGSRWLRVGPDAWVCGDEVELRAEEPNAAPEPAMVEGALTPFDYAFAAFAGVRTYRRLEDAANEDWAEQLERGMGVAVRTRTRHDGRLFARTASGRWILASELHAARPSERHGIAVPAGSTAAQVGFAQRRVDTWSTPEEALGRRRARPSGLLLERQAVSILEQRDVGARSALRTEAGWVSSEQLRRPAPAPPPEGIGPTERWVDVDVGTQTLVAYEGARPVFATLISSGRPQHATRPGVFRVWVKLASSTMSNVDDEGVDETAALYSVEHVPWVMYFHDDQALHGVYWHDRFGTRRSHGCVNLSPTDARALFDWAPPAMPPGWSAVLPTPAEPGLRVRVR